MLSFWGYSRRISYSETEIFAPPLKLWRHAVGNTSGWHCSLCPGDETGRHAGFRIPCRKAWRFNSSPGHKFRFRHSEPAGEESTAPAVVLRVIPKDLNHRDRDSCAAAKALATRGREYPQNDKKDYSISTVIFFFWGSALGIRTTKMPAFRDALIFSLLMSSGIMTCRENGPQ